MALIRSSQVTGGDPMPIRVFSAGATSLGDSLAPPPPDADLMERERYLVRAVEQLAKDRADFEAAKEAILREAQLEAQALRERAKAQGETQANDILNKANEQARGIVAVAQTDGDRLRDEANNLGFATGMTQAQSEMADAIAELRASLTAVLEDTEEQREELIRGTEAQLVELGLEAARKMTARAFADDDVFIAVLRDALGRMLDKDWVKLRVCRTDLERVRGLEDKILAAVDGLDRIEVVDDPRVEQGVVVETRHGTVDASLAGQMRELLDSIDRALEDEEGGG